MARTFDPIPSWRSVPRVNVSTQPGGGMIGVPVAPAGQLPQEAGVGGDTLAGLGFTGKVGDSAVLPGYGGPTIVAYGVGESPDMTTVRDGAAACARAAGRQHDLSMRLPGGVPSDVAAQAAVEGALLARYEYAVLRQEPRGVPIDTLTLVVADGDVAAAETGAKRGLALARAAALARDLANSPPSMLNAQRMAETAQELGTERGLSVDVFDKDALIELGCGGLLGVNAGSADPPRMIKLRYEPAGAPADAPLLTLVGKGIMYDSGGIALKPADVVHATMKNDMTGAGAILAAMTVLGELGCRAAVTAYLMCTDNMPSGSATKMGDVLIIRGGTTVEVVNTDAEGRLVMADALVLATEEPCDAIVDIATLTGSCMRALGTQVAGLFGNNQPLVDQVRRAADAAGEPVWQLPIVRAYRKEIDSDVADLKNLGGPNAAAIHAALFLEEFVAGTPWAHLDIAGTAQAEKPGGWMTPGCTGFGARLLAELACAFTTGELA